MIIWIKALHVAAVVTFLSGLLMQSVLLRMLVSAPPVRLPQERRLVSALRTWDRTVRSPALVLVWGFGAFLAWRGGWFGAGWLNLKLLLVVLLSALHGMQSGALRRAVDGTQPAPSRMHRRTTAAIVGATVAIAVLVIVKP